MQLIFTHSTCKLEISTLEGQIPKTPLGWNQETQAGSCKRVGTLLSVGAKKICEDRDLPQLIVSNGFYQYTIEFSIHIWCLLSI